MNRTSCAPDVYFPIEITRREYSGHLLLATELASRGLTCVIGHKTGVSREMRRAASAGLLFYKNNGIPKWAGKFAAMAGIDPEAGIVYEKFEDFFLKRPDLHSLTESAAQFAYGPDDFDFLSRRVLPSGRVHLTGSPRVELWGSAGDTFYAPDSERIAKRYGRFLLFTSSGGYRHEYYLKRRRFTSDVISKSSSDADAFLERILETARNVSGAVIVRLHPTDSWRQWNSLAKGFDNLFIDNALDLSAWVRCAKVVVHPGTSTAALESVLAGVPAISTNTNARVGDMMTIPNQISHQTSTVDELLVKIEDAERGKLSVNISGESVQVLRQKVWHPISGATRRVADVLESSVQFGPQSGLARRSSHRRRFVSSLRRSDRPRIGVRDEPEFKIETIGFKRIQQDVQLALTVLKCTSDIDVEPTEDDTYIIRGA